MQESTARQDAAYPNDLGKSDAASIRITSGIHDAFLRHC